MKLSPFSGTASLKLLRGAAGEGNPVLGGRGGMGAVNLAETIGMSKNVFTCKCIF